MSFEKIKAGTTNIILPGYSIFIDDFQNSIFVYVFEKKSGFEVFRFFEQIFGTEQQRLLWTSGTVSIQFQEQIRSHLFLVPFSFWQLVILIDN